MPLSPDRRSRLADLVRREGYEYREEPFELSSGGRSHDYVDCRHVVASGEALALVGQAIVDAVEVEWDVVGGPTMGADPLAHAVSMLTGRPWFSVRKAPKGHGRGSWLEGHRLESGDRVLAVEDTTSTGRSLLEAVERIRDTGADVVVAATLLDRSPAVAGRFAEVGIPWRALVTWEDLGIEAL